MIMPILDRRQLDEALQAARKAGSGRFDWLIRQHVAVVPERLAAYLPRFGAGVWFSIVFVDPRLLDAPASAVRFVMAHEWGHVERGHIPFAFLALVVGLSRATVDGAPPTLLTMIANLLVFAIIAYSIVGKGSKRRELEADAFAAEAVGRDQAAEGLRWLVNWRGQGWSPALRERGDALGLARRAGGQRAA